MRSRRTAARVGDIYRQVPRYRDHEIERCIEETHPLHFARQLRVDTQHFTVALYAELDLVEQFLARGAGLALRDQRTADSRLHREAAGARQDLDLSGTGRVEAATVSDGVTAIVILGTSSCGQAEQPEQHQRQGICLHPGRHR